MDKTVIKKIKIIEKQNDFMFWQSQPFEKRLEALEEIRREYIQWKYGTIPRLQRVYRIAKRK